MEVLDENGILVASFIPRITKVPRVSFLPLPAEMSWQNDDAGISVFRAAGIAVRGSLSLQFLYLSSLELCILCFRGLEQCETRDKNKSIYGCYSMGAEY